MEQVGARGIIYTGRAATGSDDPAHGRRLLRAGPLTALLDGMDLRYVRLGDREILRRVYVAVRDPNWNTIPAVYSDVHLHVGATSFEISFEARHRAGPIDFAWRGTLRGADDGTIEYIMDGEALNTFRKNRIGFCILHPMACAGHSCAVTHVDGSVERGIFPTYISPHQPFMEFNAIAHELQPGLTAELRLSGDTFEMEDQRNWTDASYKTYSTPLRLPFPAEVAAGTRISQAVALSLHGAIPTAGAREDESSTLGVTIDPSSAYALPRLGLGMASHEGPLSEREVGRLRALRLAHLRIDLDLTDSAHGATLQRGVRQSRALAAPLEMALFVSDDAVREIATLADALRHHEPRIARWLVFHRGEPVTSAHWVELAHQTLGPYAPGAPFGGGSNAYFTQLNRNRPPAGALNVVAYSINPQVHAFDDTSLVETLPAQAVTLESARQFVGDSALAVGPVTLRPRFNPDATAPAPAPAPGELPSAVDPRQNSLFGAGWTLGSIAYLARGGAGSVTYYETTGWRGVMEREEGSPAPRAFPSTPGMVFPLYHVLADVAEFADATVLRSSSDDALSVEALALRDGSRVRVLLANMTGEPREVVVHLPGLSAARVHTLDERSFERATRDPDTFRRAPSGALTAVDGQVRLALLPYAVARIDGEIAGQRIGA